MNESENRWANCWRIIWGQQSGRLKKWAHQNEVTAEGIEKFIRKEPGWILGGKNIEKVFYTLDHAVAKVEPLKVAVDGITMTAMGGILIIATQGTATYPVLMESLARLGISGASSSVASKVGEELLIKTGASQENANRVVTYAGYLGAYRDLSRVYQKTR